MMQIGFWELLEGRRGGEVRVVRKYRLYADRAAFVKSMSGRSVSQAIQTNKATNMTRDSSMMVVEPSSRLPIKTAQERPYFEKLAHKIASIGVH